MKEAIGWLLLSTLLTGTDWANWQRSCRTAPGIQAPYYCKDRDLDRDGDVDLNDFGLEQARDHSSDQPLVYVIVAEPSLGVMIDPDKYLAGFFAKRAGQ